MIPVESEAQRYAHELNGTDMRFVPAIYVFTIDDDSIYDHVDRENLTVNDGKV